MKRRLLILSLFFCAVSLLFVALFWFTLSEIVESFGTSGIHIGLSGPFEFSIEPANFLITLALAAMAGLMNLYLLYRDHARQREKSSVTPLTPIDSVLSFLELFLPARTMKEVAGDVRERLDLLQNASPWEIRRQFAAGLFLIFLDALREALAFRRKKRG